ncbi:MAG: epimerase [Euzebya sp.]
MATIVIAGGTGFLGRNLSRRLVDRGDRVIVLTRGRTRTADGVDHVNWDAQTLGPWTHSLDGANAIVHLTGKRVDCRPTARNIAALISSRVQPVLLVGRALRVLRAPPPLWVQSGTLAIYGEGGDTVITEDTPVDGIGPQQMVQVALAWEAAYRHATVDVERTVLLRIGVTIGGDDDPATARLAQLARLGLGGAVGSGRQWMSWVGLDDAMNVMLTAIDDRSMHGLFHLTAPSPQRNADVMAALRGVVGQRVGIPSPAWLTRIGAPVLGVDPALALTGRRCVPQRLLAHGVTFDDTDIAQALCRAVQGSAQDAHGHTRAS